ncbi:hypothetical protein [Flagellimonas allohymeniacidonis]|uniref:Uncharacterized protein n=1 Tax=Flagellimonas allohymeniacidonis TaxID=2517819 RepID=A0A4Q8QCN3_9FLAO|nr:hypothetical protein [Allomuricauda hymeniacidonis]TAI47444.1 hypothetical protein EW142_12285 [Allomuricauda hymeniacidonis]
MKSKNWIGLALILGLAACSSEFEPVEQPLTPTSGQGVDFMVVGEDLDKVYQFTYSATVGNGSSIDLTEELNVPSDYLTLRQKDDVLSFYSFEDGFFSLSLKNVNTGQTTLYEDFYLNTLERSIAWGINDEDAVFFGYFGPNGARNLALQDFELQGSESTDFTIDFNITATFTPLLFDGKVYISFTDSMGNYKLTFYDTEVMAVGPILDFNTTPISFFITDAGELAVVKNQLDTSLDTYGADDLLFINSVPMDINLGFSPGAVNDVILAGDVLYFNVDYPQPSRFSEGPAVYNLSTKEINILDMFSIVEEVEQEVGANLTITTQVYDPLSNVFLIGYAILDNEAQGGVIQASVNGDLLADVPLSFFPTYFVRN